MKTKKSIGCTILFLFILWNANAQPSVLSTGNWYKLSVSQNGIYCITHSDLIALGINASSIDPRNISLYGNIAGTLPIQNNVPHVDDLKEIAINIKGESDGIFDLGDTIYFYGQSQIVIDVDSLTQRFYHRQNIYTDSTCYFLTIGTSAGKRISSIANQPTFTNTTTTYTDFICHELDSINLLHSGKIWFGEEVKSQSSRTVSFDISHISQVNSVFLQLNIGGRSLVGGGTFDISFNNTQSIHTFSAVGNSPQDNYINPLTVNKFYTPPFTNGIFQCSLISMDSSAIGWIDYIELNLTRDLYLYKPQQLFTDIKLCGPGNITRYIMDNVNPSLQIWDVTDPQNVMNQQFNSAIPSAEFNANNDSAHSYMAFDGTMYLVPRLIGQIPNQDLHSISQANLIIVTAPDFINEATTLAGFHQSNDGLQSIVVTTDQIYNEYSTGSQDPVGIRDFIRQVYNRSAANNDSLKYLLLFGCASYDYKINSGNYSNIVPTYESTGSINLTQTRNYDDFYGYIDDNADDVMDIVRVGIGRIPAKNSTDASVINKIMSYNSPATLGYWRKQITFVADDNDQNTHVKQTDTLANRLENRLCDFDIRKIYFDAYVKDYSGPYPTYPGVTSDIKDCIDSGSLVIQYIGHGSSHFWGDERVLDLQTLQGADNIKNLPLFINATSVFNKYDDPADTSCGQIISLSNIGAGIASIGSTRLAFSSSNFNFTAKLSSHLFEKENDRYLRLGDVFRKTKMDHFSDPYVTNICLLGDPAIRLNYPENNVVTTAINGLATSTQPDTLLPGQHLIIDGEVHDNSGNILSGFNGTIYIIVFNQKSLHYTLGNDTGQGSPQQFYSWDDTLIFDSVQVTNGSFTSSFYLPYNVDSGYGFGKISYYAQNGSTDASGCYQNFIYKNLNPGIVEIPGIKITVYPSPSMDKVEIKIEGIETDNFKFVLNDARGRQVLLKEIVENSFFIEKKSLSAGMYFFKIFNKNHQQVKNGKIIFQ